MFYGAQTLPSPSHRPGGALGQLHPVTKAEAEAGVFGSLGAGCRAKAWLV